MYIGMKMEPTGTPTGNTFNDGRSTTHADAAAVPTAMPTPITPCNTAALDSDKPRLASAHLSYEQLQRDRRPPQERRDPQRDPRELVRPQHLEHVREIMHEHVWLLQAVFVAHADIRNEYVDERRRCVDQHHREHGRVCRRLHERNMHMIDPAAHELA